MKRSLFLLFILTCPMVGMAQNAGFWAEAEIGLGVTLADKADNYGLCEPRNNVATTIGVSAGYYVSPQFSLGATTGIISLTNPGLNLLPVCAEVRMRPFASPFFFGLRAGVPLAINEPQYEKGLVGGLYCGYSFVKVGRFHLMPAIGYDYIGYKVTDAAGELQSGHRGTFLFRLQIGLGG